MPQPLADTETLRRDAEALFQEGLLPAAIARRLKLNPSTVRTWKARFNWDANVARVAELMQQPHGEVDKIVSNIKQRAIMLRSRVLGDVERQMDIIEGEPPKHLSDLRNEGTRQGRTKLVRDLSHTINAIAPEEDGPLVGPCSLLFLSNEELEAPPEKPAVDVESERCQTRSGP